MIGMPISPETRWLYPIDWCQLSSLVRFERAGGRCERCARPHLHKVQHLGDGRWFDAEASVWRDGRGLRVRVSEHAARNIRWTKVVLACAHLDHNPSNNRFSNLAALCQRCHMLHDAHEHRRRRWLNLHRQKAVADLFDQLRPLLIGGASIT